MGFIETLKKRFTPEGATAVATPPHGVPAEYPREVLRVVSTTWNMGMSYFIGTRYQLGLAEMFCGVVRERLLDEIEGVRRPSSVPLSDILRNAKIPTPAVQAFSQLTPEQFDDSYARLRIEYTNRGADIEKVADALLNVVETMRYITELA